MGLMMPGLSFMGSPRSAVVAATVWNSSTDTPPSSGDWSRSGLTITRVANTAFWATARASTLKASGAVGYAIGALGGGAFQYIGFDDGLETINLGGSSHSIGWRSDGAIFVNGGVAASNALWAWGAADVPNIIKSNNLFTFSKNGGATLTTYDAVGKPVLIGSLYPAVGNGNSTGMAVTLDPSAW